MSNYNNFELLLSAASEQSCNKLAEHFLSLNTSEKISASEYKRFKQMRKETKRGKRIECKPLKIAVAVCLIVLSLYFVACMCIPKIRTAIKEVILEWYEDFVAVGFLQNENTTDSGNLAVPDRIIDKAYASYLPDSYTYKVNIDNDIYYSTSYYFKDNYMFSIMQNTISNELNWSNAPNQQVKNILINGYDAILIKELNETNMYTLVWQTDYYEFNIIGKFQDENELIKIASGISIN